MSGSPRVVLLNDLALQLRPDVLAPDGPAARVIVAGRCLVRMTLAELAIPEARMIWTDFRHSASLGALHGAVQAEGGLDRMILAAEGHESDSVFSVMNGVLSLLPALRGREASHIDLICTAGQAAASLVLFVDHIRPRLADEGVSVALDILERRADRVAA